MDIFVYDKDFKQIASVDDYISLIWTERYYEAGEFSLKLSALSPWFASFMVGNYLRLKNNNTAMIIEQILVQQTVEDGIVATISGRSLSSLLRRRVLWSTQYTASNDNAAKFICDVVERQTSGDSEHGGINRKFPIVVDRAYTGLAAYTNRISCQCTLYSLYEFVQELCMLYDVGFILKWPAPEDNAHNFIFSLYEGVERTIGNSDGRAFVVFSEEYDNLVSMNYKVAMVEYCNTALVLGEDSGSSRRRVVVNKHFTGMDRYELLVDARDIQSETNDPNQPEDDSTYLQKLAARGKEKLAKTLYSGEVEAEVEPNTTFKYGTDYFLGDVVSIMSSFGIATDARITEYTISVEGGDTRAFPTLTII